MSKYAEMTDDEMKKWTAARLGYRIVSDKDYTFVPPLTVYFMRGPLPEGERLGMPEREPELVLQYAPDWPTSADAALPLIADYNADIRLGGEGARVRLYALATVFESVHPLLARAICEAWLAMTDGEG